MPQTTLRSQGVLPVRVGSAAGRPAGQVGNGGAVVGIQQKLGGDRRLMLDDLITGAGLRGLAAVAVAERRAGQDVDRPGPGPVGLAAPVPLHELGFLVLGEHALELHHQLVLRAVTLRALDEPRQRAGAGELLDQQAC